MVKLFVESTNLHSPVAAVRWCVDKNTVNKLKELGVSNPYMLFVVARENDGEFRKVDHRVVPLDQAMEYLEFHGGGKHRIFGCLVWQHGTKTKKELTRHLEYFYLYNDNETGSVDSEGNFHKPYEYTHSDLDFGSVDVVVPDGYFAKEPAAWEKWWVNLWYESKPVNQCHFRKRRLLAYSVQPPVILVYVLFKGLVLLGQILLLTLCGIRETKYGAFLHPFTYGLDWDCVPYEKSSVFVKDSSGNDRHPIFFLFMPMVQIVLLVLVGAVKLLLGWLGLSIGSALLWFLGINAVVILAVFAVNMMGGLDNLLPPAETEEQRLARRKLELERLYAEYQDMVCSGVPLQPSVSALPSQRRTFHLRFQELKSKVCLPFAR